MSKYEIHKVYNLVFVKWLVKSDEDFAEEYQKLGEKIVKDPDFEEGMDMISDFRHAVLPDSQVYYNDMTKKIKFHAGGGLGLRLLDNKTRRYKQYLDIFSIFFKGDKFFENIKTVYDLSEAFMILGIPEQEERLKGFFDID